jgi:WD40 repeat protein
VGEWRGRGAGEWRGRGAGERRSGGIFDVAFSPDGTRLATAGKDGKVRLYVLDIDELVELAKSGLTQTWTVEECQQFLPVQTCPEGLLK